MKIRWQEGEPAILNNLVYAYAYSKMIGRCEDLENLVISKAPNTKGIAKFVYLYSSKIMKKRWPEAEFLLKDSHYLIKYCNRFKIDILSEEESNKLLCDCAFGKFSKTKLLDINKYFEIKKLKNK